MTLIQKLRSRNTAVFFLMMSYAWFAYAQEVSQLPSDFLEFYAKFRRDVIDQNYRDIVDLTCFPFKAFDLTETLDTVPYKKKLHLIRKQSFVKHDLAKYFLKHAGDIPSDTPIVENGITKRLVYLYRSNEQLITENDDPRSLKKLPRNSSGYESGSKTVFISGLEFTKRENVWCWSYASYMRGDKDKW